ncbi:MAG TPA: IS1595 family transposase [Solirubrobacteraceae bacterium]|nr:IS1595 family transposase [Solirubrobacteraceae bacterium]
MAAKSRDSVERQPSSGSQMTYSDFLRLFPDNAACMDYLRDRFYPAGAPCPKCGKATKFHRIKGRSAYACQYCRHQVYPTAGTIFHKSTTSLQLWFWAIFLMSSTRCGISAKQLEREIGVGYKTAHRMFKEIRTLLAQDDCEPLGGEVEVDETGYGGKPRAYDTKGMSRPEVVKWTKERKTTVLGMVERGGRVRAHIQPERSPKVVDTVREYVLPSAMVFTDDWAGYKKLHATHPRHRRVKHSEKIYVDGNVHTNTVEGFFGLLKNGIRGVYHAVSTDYLQAYLDEYAFRYNHRNDRKPMFWTILENVQKPSVA